MVTINQKLIGYSLILFSIILLVILSFVKVNVDKEGAYLCSLVSSNPDIDMEQCPAHESNTSWLLTILFGLSFLILGSGIYLSFIPTKREQETNKVDLSKLGKEETLIYNLLKQNQGSMYQSDLIKETQFSKVKTTRLLDKMESKNIIDRKRRGMTNIIILK